MITHNIVTPISAGRSLIKLRDQRKVARDRFCRTLGWVRGHAFTSAQLRLAEGWRHPLEDGWLTAHQNGCIDLPEYYCERHVPAAIVSLTACPIGQVHAYAELENLRVEPMPSFWPAPDGRLAVCFMRPDHFAKHERPAAGGKT
jgi:hypothetical protein